MLHPAEPIRHRLFGLRSPPNNQVDRHHRPYPEIRIGREPMIVVVRTAQRSNVAVVNQGSRRYCESVMGRTASTRNRDNRSTR